MSSVTKMLGLILVMLLVVAFLNHGQLTIGANPQGATFWTGYSHTQ